MLDKIILDKHRQISADKSNKSLSYLKDIITQQDKALDLYASIFENEKHKKISIIAECKKKSPSKGVLCEDYKPENFAKLYERGGAVAISVLTDETFFGGSLDDIKKVKQQVNIPILRKDFVIDEYQIWQARSVGADSFLLIAGVLDYANLQYFIEIGRELGMEPLVEAHNQEELDIALKTDAKIVGINSRDLNTFATNLDGLKKYKKQLRKNKKDRIFICESGVSSHENIIEMRKYGYSGFLIGETLMKSSNPELKIQDLLGNN